MTLPTLASIASCFLRLSARQANKIVPLDLLQEGVHCSLAARPRWRRWRRKTNALSRLRLAHRRRSSELTRSYAGVGATSGTNGRVGAGVSIDSSKAVTFAGTDKRAPSSSPPSSGRVALWSCAWSIEGSGELLECSLRCPGINITTTRALTLLPRLASSPLLLSEYPVLSSSSHHAQMSWTLRHQAPRVYPGLSTTAHTAETAARSRHRRAHLDWNHIDLVIRVITSKK